MRGVLLIAQYNSVLAAEYSDEKNIMNFQVKTMDTFAKCNNSESRDSEA